MDQTPRQFGDPGGSGHSAMLGQYDGNDVERTVERLKRLTDQIVSFLYSQNRRLSDVAQSMDAIVHRVVTHEERVHELERRKVEWEQQRKIEEQRLAEEARLLSQAWDRVEEERREDLIGGRGNEMPPEESFPQSPVPSGPVVQNASSCSNSDLFDLGVPTPLPPSAVQFQQMKREIRQHARRNR